MKKEKMEMNILKKYLSVAMLTLPLIAEASLSWSQPASVRAEGRYDTANLSINELNQALIIGVGTINEHDVIQASYYSNAWCPVVNCSSYGSYYLLEPKVVLNNKKNALAIWRKVEENHDSIQASFASNGVWSVPVDVIHVSGQLVDQQLAFNDAEEGIAVWLNNIDYRLQYATFSNGKWNEPEFLSEKAEVEQRPLNIRVVMNQAGEKIVTWMSVSEGGYKIYAKVGTKEGWTEQESFGHVNDWNQYSIAMNNKGEAVIAWIGLPYSKINVVDYSNKTWSVSHHLSSDEDVHAISVSLNNNGNALLAWSDLNKVNVLRKFRGMWGKLTVLSNPEKITKVQKVILNDLEEGVLSYTEADLPDPVPFPLQKPNYAMVRGFYKETWERPIMLFARLGKNPSEVIDIALNNSGKTWAIGLNKKGFKVANGSF